MSFKDLCPLEKLHLCQLEGEFRVKDLLGGAPPVSINSIQRALAMPSRGSFETVLHCSKLNIKVDDTRFRSKYGSCKVSF